MILLASLVLVDLVVSSVLDALVAEVAGAVVVVAEVVAVVEAVVVDVAVAVINNTLLLKRISPCKNCCRDFSF